MNAQLSARDLAEAGYHAHADAVRSAGNAAASADDPSFAEVCADYALDALGGNRAPCELSAQVSTERRWQWAQLPAPQIGAQAG